MNVIDYITTENLNNLIKEIHNNHIVILYNSSINGLGICKKIDIETDEEICYLKNVDMVHRIDAIDINLNKIDKESCINYPDKWGGIDGLDINEIPYTTSIYIDRYNHVLLRIKLNLYSFYIDNYNHDVYLNIYLEKCMFMIDSIPDDKFDHGYNDISHLLSKNEEVVDVIEKKNDKEDTIEEENKESKWKFTLWNKSCCSYEIFDPWFAKAPLFSSIDQAKKFIDVTDIYTLSNIIVPVDVNNVYKAPRDGFIDCDNSYYFRGNIIQLHTLERIALTKFLGDTIDIYATILGGGIEFVDGSTINNDDKKKVVIDVIKTPIKGYIQTMQSVTAKDQIQSCRNWFAEDAEYMSVIYNKKDLILTFFYNKEGEEKSAIVVIPNIKGVIFDKIDPVPSA